MHRFFLPPGSIAHQRVLFPQETASQIREVLRLKPGEKVVVLDGQGWQYDVELRRVERDVGEGVVLFRKEAGGEPKLELELYQALLKGDKFEFILQKGTELGIRAFYPTITRRCIPGDVPPQKIERWGRIIREAAEQSGRGRLPHLSPPLPFPQACSRPQGLALLPWEGEDHLGLREALEHYRGGPISLFIGPEGGFEAQEVELGREKGIVPVSLGPRILRAETAGLVAAAAIFYALGELEPGL